MDDAADLELFTGRKQIRNATVVNHRCGILRAVLKDARAIDHGLDAVEMR
jgi:hypothetical protein